MKRKLFAVLTAMLLGLCASVSADLYAVVYNTASLNVRSGPSQSYTWLGSVSRGGWVQILGESGNWAEVLTVDEGITGYMSKNFLKTAETSAPGGGVSAVVRNPVSTQFLNLRAAPSYDAQVLGIFYNGTTCTVLSQQSDGWWFVSLWQEGTQLYGFFRSEFLQITGGGVSGETMMVSTPNGGSLNLRSAPSYGSPVVTTIPNRAVVERRLEGASFSQITYSGQSGFVDNQYITASGGGGGSMPIGGTAVVQTANGGSLNLRENPNTSARILGRYYNGTTLTVLQQGSVWCRVRVDSTGKAGYMMTKFLSFGTAPAPSSSTRTVVNPNGGTYVNMRSMPEQNSWNVVLQVPVGAMVTVLTWGSAWSRVIYGGTSGYMMSAFLQ